MYMSISTYVYVHVRHLMYSTSKRTRSSPNAPGLPFRDSKSSSDDMNINSTKDSSNNEVVTALVLTEKCVCVLLTAAIITVMNNN